MGLQFTIYGWKRCHQLDSLTWEIRTLKNSYHLRTPWNCFERRLKKSCVSFSLYKIVKIFQSNQLNWPLVKLIYIQHWALSTVEVRCIQWCCVAAAGHWRLWGETLHPPHLTCVWLNVAYSLQWWDFGWVMVENNLSVRKRIGNIGKTFQWLQPQLCNKSPVMSSCPMSPIIPK